MTELRRQKDVPSYLRHKRSGQAYTILRDPDGRRRQIALGEHGTPESRRRYREVVARYLRGEPATPESQPAGARARSATELRIEYLPGADSRSRRTALGRPHGEPRDQAREEKPGLRQCVSGVACGVYCEERPCLDNQFLLASNPTNEEPRAAFCRG
jgi:hypothetical protein